MSASYHPSRREFLAGSATFAAAGTLVQPVRGQSLQLPAPGEYPVLSISSGNGQPATAKTYEMILAGQDTLDAVVAGVNIVEDDPDDMTVGLGGFPNEEGDVELDAAVMHGPTHQAGAVASLRHIRNPSQVARLVMQQTDHVLLVGKGALEFALAHGFQKENLLTDKARQAWLKWKQNLSDEDDWLPPPDDADDKVAIRQRFERPTGTIHCAGMNADGEISCTTTTSGLAFKIPGRVGDSPLIAAGLYVDNEIGSCGATGRGEEVIRNAGSFAAVELMRTGMAPQDAGLEVLRRIAKHAPPRLKDAMGRPNFNVQLYLLRKDGAYAGVSLRGQAKFAVTDAQGTRTENSAVLFS